VKHPKVPNIEWKKNPSRPLGGQRLSPIDVVQINRLYKGECDRRRLVARNAFRTQENGNIYIFFKRDSPMQKTFVYLRSLKNPIIEQNFKIFPPKSV